jgi:hypothetical protein
VSSTDSRLTPSATVAINGLGRIGRAALRILLDADRLDLVAVNDIVDADNLAYLIKYDTVYGRYHREVAAVDGALVVDGRRIPAFSECIPAYLPWDELNVDLVLECTGGFTTAEDLEKHVQAGAPYVILSAPTSSETVTTVVLSHRRQEGGARRGRRDPAPPRRPGRSGRGRRSSRRVHDALWGYRPDRAAERGRGRHAGAGDARLPGERAHEP